MGTQRRESVCGNTGKDPEEIYDKNGKLFTKFSVCVRDYDDGVCWYDVLAKGNLAAFALRYLEKGRLVTCSGLVETRPYSGKDGVARVSRTMRADRITHGQETAELEAQEEPTTAVKSEEALARDRYEHVRQYPPRWLAGQTIPDPSPEDLERTPHEEARARLKAIIRSLVVTGGGSVGEEEALEEKGQQETLLNEMPPPF